MANDALRKMEIELSLLYEAFHTKLPVIVSKPGYIDRMLNLSCILGALLSFSLVKKHYELEEFDTRLTYGLLIRALTLGFVSIILLVFSEWFVIAHFHIMESKPIFINRFINRRRWSKTVPQLNFITYYVKEKDHPNWLKKLATYVNSVRSLLEAIKGIQCLSFQNFREGLLWSFIFGEVISMKFQNTAPEIKVACFQRSKQFLQNNLIYEHLRHDVEEQEEADYTQFLLTWHIATDLCLRGEDDQRSSSRSNNDHRAICKLLSDYMFYLLMMEPPMMATVVKNWKKIFNDTYADADFYVGRSLVSNEKDASREILSFVFDMTTREDRSGSVLFAARELASHLQQSDGAYPWELMSHVWAEIICHAAINCRRNVHAQQPSKGGELLTFIWLCMTTCCINVLYLTRNVPPQVDRDAPISVSDP